MYLNESYLYAYISVQPFMKIHKDVMGRWKIIAERQLRSILTHIYM